MWFSPYIRFIPNASHTNSSAVPNNKGNEWKVLTLYQNNDHTSERRGDFPCHTHDSSVGSRHMYLLDTGIYINIRLYQMKLQAEPKGLTLQSFKFSFLGHRFNIQENLPLDIPLLAPAFSISFTSQSIKLEERQSKQLRVPSKLAPKIPYNKFLYSFAAAFGPSN